MVGGVEEWVVQALLDFVAAAAVGGGKEVIDSEVMVLVQFLLVDGAHVASAVELVRGGL